MRGSATPHRTTAVAARAASLACVRIEIVAADCRQKIERRCEGSGGCLSIDAVKLLPGDGAVGEAPYR